MIDWNKPVQTRDGREVTVHTIHGKRPGYPVIAEYVNEDGISILDFWTIKGRSVAAIRAKIDLVNVPEEKWEEYEDGEWVEVVAGVNFRFEELNPVGHDMFVWELTYGNRLFRRVVE